MTLRSRINTGGKLVLEVEDDGVGIAPDRGGTASQGTGLTRAGTGIGMRNVRERMMVLYGETASVEVNSRPGRGTQVTLLMPILDADLASRSQIGPLDLKLLSQTLSDAVRNVMQS